jgi:hypothetical protein
VAGGSGLDIAYRLSGERPGVFEKYWNTIRVPTDLREAILRYANYRDYLAQLERNARGGEPGPDGKPTPRTSKPDNYGASIPQEIDALRDFRDKAYHLANDLLGPYDETTVLGRWLRERMFPFWSWKESNTRRWYRLWQNAKNNPEVAEKVGRKLLGKAAAAAGRFALIRIGRFAIMALSFWALTHLYNWTFHRKEEAALPPQIRGRMHVTLGRDPTGNVAYMGRLGAFADAAAWIGADEAPYYWEAFVNNRLTLAEIAKQMAVAPANELYQATGPYKTGFELVMGKDTYPDMTRPRQIRDRWEHLSRAVGLDAEYRIASGKPNRGAADFAARFVTNHIDPEEATYNDMRGLVGQWAERQGIRGGGGDEPTPRANAIYYFKQSLRFGDKPAAARWLREYARLGGSDDSLEKSLENLHPLGGLSDENRAEFVKGLSKEDQLRLRRAVFFWGRLVAPTVDLADVMGRDLQSFLRMSEDRVDRYLYRQHPVKETGIVPPGKKPGVPINR